MIIVIMSDELNKKCSDVDIAKVADLVTSWETLCPYFRISEQEKREIERDNDSYAMQKREMFYKWRRKLGDDATLEKLRGSLYEANQTILVQKFETKFEIHQPHLLATPFKDSNMYCEGDKLQESISPVQPEVLISIYKEYSADLAAGIEATTDFANRLESASLISDDVVDRILTTLGIARIDKTTMLLKSVEKKMKKEKDPSNSFIKLCKILNRYETVKDIAITMKKRAGIIDSKHDVITHVQQEKDLQQELKLNPPSHHFPKLEEASAFVANHDYDEFDTRYGQPKLKELLLWVAAQVPASWEGVGLQLDIPQAHLNAIRMKITNGGDAMNFFKDVFIEWEKAPHEDSPYCWKTILEALASPFVGQSVLANKIAATLRKRNV